jgi:hypothetical protein
MYTKLQDISPSRLLYLNCLSKGKVAASVLQSSNVQFLAHQSAAQYCVQVDTVSILAYNSYCLLIFSSHIRLFSCNVLLCINKAPFIMLVLFVQDAYRLFGFSTQNSCCIFHFPFNFLKCRSYRHFERGRFAKYKKPTSFVVHLQQAECHVATVRFSD